ncbi:predicted protein [Naegleria gruberi]|uniref:Predicted protein n=1 Tax=Naegleria gruberi TaxID=5762 RepID=D2VG33_NAEGR|nr:uncharacterized protein NAEGRDRAFT_49247 [Naegleria gruberi]EFC44282.1 predicted protein [Naegleria gruberi]|eukprot:XP_002677026.1 predicted protein [Naegleria gruberi strain NEG-M]
MYRPPISPSEFDVSEEASYDVGDIIDMNDEEDESSIDLNDFDSEVDSEDSDDGPELLFEDKAIEYSVEELNDDDEVVDECQMYIENYVKRFQCTDEEIREFCQDKTKEDIHDNWQRLEERLLKLKDTLNGNFKGLDTTLRDSIIHQLALQEFDKQVVKKKKRVDATLNKNTRPNRKRKSAPTVDEENDMNDFIDDEGVEEVITSDEEPTERIIKTVILNEKQQALADEIEKCIMEKNNNKFREYLRMYARREIPVVVAFKTKLAYHFRRQQYEQGFKKMQQEAQKLKLKEQLAEEALQNQHIVEEVKESVTFIKKQHGEYELEYQDYVMDHQIDCLRTAINRMMQGKSLLIVLNDNENMYDKMLEFDKGGRMMVMTYDRCMNILKNSPEEALYLKKADILVIDEAHVIKNPESERFKHFSSFSKSIKLLVTGTPLQNSIAEIFTLIRFLEPQNPYVRKLMRCFNSTFTEFFSKNRKNIENREVLARTEVFYNYFKELIHRKVNIKEMEEIAKKKEDIIIEFKMSKEEKDIYEFISQKYRTKCYFARYFYQRLCLDCVDYLKESDEKDLEEFSQEYNDEDVTPESFQTTLKKYIQESHPKLTGSTRVKILKNLVSRIVGGKKEKVVVFSGLVCYNSVIVKELSKDNTIKIGVFTGDTSSPKRAEIINQFNRGIINTLLISKNAGGVGIDLTTATNVVLFNLDFNFAKDDQAICRLVRKNQKEQVKIFRLVCRESVDVAVKELQAHKTVIFDKLLDDIPSIIKPRERNEIPEDLCIKAFGNKFVPASIKKLIVNIEKFQLTEGSIDLTEDEVETAQNNIESDML